MESINKERMNPWLSMWIKPRATILQVTEHVSIPFLFLLVVAAGIGIALNGASARNSGDTFSLPTILLFATIAGPIIGVVALYIGSIFLHWTGKSIGGHASVDHIQIAMVWSCVPLIWAMALWIPELILFGIESFTTETPRIDASIGLMRMASVFELIKATIIIWVLVVFLKSLGQVQRFSNWRALGNVFLAALSPIMLALLISTIVNLI